MQVKVNVMSKNGKIEGESGLEIRVHLCDSLKGQHLWFGNKDGRHVGTLTHRTKLKKLRRWINEILDESEGQGDSK